eukprot:7712917-Ditylum_brightwellii.AAC.2
MTKEVVDITDNSLSDWKGREEEQIIFLEAGNWRSCKSLFKVCLANGEEVRNLGTYMGIMKHLEQI